jgi:hypothetical protein
MHFLLFARHAELVSASRLTALPVMLNVVQHLGKDPETSSG